jgi:hypothetical protein
MYTENRLGTSVHILHPPSLMARTIKLSSAHKLAYDTIVTSHNPKTKLSFSQPTGSELQHALNATPPYFVQVNAFQQQIVILSQELIMVYVQGNILI